MNIYVGNLPYRLSESELAAMFEAHGTVNRTTILTDRETGRSRGFGFVEMANDDEANNAITALDGSEVSGRALKVNQAKPSKGRG